MGFKCGIVGLPNVGKSTLFYALTQAGIEAANYPFCTIEPNVGIVPMPDTRLDALAKLVKPQRVLPTTMEFVDLAGLLAGASTGKGLGYKVLARIREFSVQEVAEFLPVCSACEAEIDELSESDKCEFLAYLCRDEPWLNRVI